MNLTCPVNFHHQAEKNDNKKYFIIILKYFIIIFKVYTCRQMTKSMSLLKTFKNINTF